MQVWRNCQVLSAQTSDSSAFLDVTCLKVCTQLWTERFILRSGLSDIWINCNRFSGGSLYSSGTLNVQSQLRRLYDFWGRRTVVARLRAFISMYVCACACLLLATCGTAAESVIRSTQRLPILPPMWDVPASNIGLRIDYPMEIFRGFLSRSSKCSYNKSH
jgi:hypothetical protein